MQHLEESVQTVDLDFLPEEVGYIKENIPLLDRHLLRLIKEKKIVAAAYLLSRDNKIFAQRSMGQLRYDDEKQPYLPDTIRSIASITKIFTSIAIIQLVEKGIINLNQPVCEIISEFNNPMLQKITIFHLLTHSSGIRPDPGCMSEPYPYAWDWFGKESWIKETLRDNIHFETGTQWRYSSTGFAILGEIISRKSGIPYEQHVMEKIIHPLNLQDTFFTVPAEKERRLCFTCKEQQEWYEKGKKRPDWAAPPAGGGLFSTLADLQKVGQMLINKGTLNGVRVLSRKAVESMTREQICYPNYTWGCPGTKMEYGLGFNVYANNTFLSPGSFSHEGAGLCGLYMDPIEKIVFAYFCPLAKDVEWAIDAVINLRNIAWAGII